MSTGLREALRRRGEERGRVIREALRFGLRMREKLGRITLLLYGSYARGDFNLWSDVDLILISERFSGVPVLRRLDLIAEDIPPRFEIRCLTPEEALGEFSKPWWKKVLEEAVIILDDLELLEANGEGEKEEVEPESSND